MASLRQTRLLSSEGRQLFENKVQKFSSKLSIPHKYIDFILNDLQKFSILDPMQANEYRTELIDQLKKYKEVSVEFTDYLVSVRCEESMRERISHDIVSKSIEEKVSFAIFQLDSLIKTMQDQITEFETKEEKQPETSENAAETIPPPVQFSQQETNEYGTEIIPPPFQFTTQLERHETETHESQSRYPMHIKHSKTAKTHKETSSSVLARQQAKLEAAKVKARFALEEAQLIKKQAAIQAEMTLLKVDQEVEAAECELKALSETFEDKSSISDLEFSRQASENC